MSVRLLRVLRQIAMQLASKCITRRQKREYQSPKIAPHRLRKEFFISIWSPPEVLNSDQQTLHFAAQSACAFKTRQQQKPTDHASPTTLILTTGSPNRTGTKAHAPIHFLLCKHLIPHYPPTKRLHKNCNCHFFFVTL